MTKEILIAGIVGLLLGALLFGSWGYAPFAGSGSPMMGGWRWGFGQESQFNPAEMMDRHFIEQMIPHHQVAVDMAELALQKAEHSELTQLAQRISRDQNAEIEKMRSWYKSWYGIDPPEFFVGIGPGMMSGGMMGGGQMSNGFDSSVLESLETGNPFDKNFIEQMIPHHQMAIMMSQMLLARTSRSELQELGRSIISTQSAEIKQMREWYAAWYDQK